MTEEMEVKRGRGRPKGASWLNAEDDPVLERMADRMIADPKLKATTAARREGVTEGSDVRRLQRKWARYGDAHIEAARYRKSAKAARTIDRSASLGSYSGSYYPGALSAVERAYQDAVRIQEVVDRMNPLKDPNSGIGQVMREVQAHKRIMEEAMEPALAAQRMIQEQMAPFEAIRHQMDDLTMAQDRLRLDTQFYGDPFRRPF